MLRRPALNDPPRKLLRKGGEMVGQVELVAYRVGDAERFGRDRPHGTRETTKGIVASNELASRRPFPVNVGILVYICVACIGDTLPHSCVVVA
jgi:hypothetical protein